MHLLRVAAATVMPLASLVAAAPATAAPAGACPDAHGVSVVVEPAALGGSPEVACVPLAAGDTGADLFEKAGHRFTRVSSMPDVVCRIDDRPRQAGCAQMPPATAYWSLWVSDPHGRWTYSSRNINETTVTSGGGIAFRWVDGNVSRAPATVLADAVGAPASPSPVSVPAAGPAADRGPSALPGWVAPSLVVLLGAVAVVIWRRRA